MSVSAYYNEIDPYAAQWLRNLIAAGHIAPGDVDERSIRDVRADDLRGYAQCHFFAGIGGWSVALRLAGWPDDRSVWTGSCPCQPFSAAGAGKAADDERHLWPSWLPLIAERRPAIVFGEQVEAAIGWGWLDLVLADLEGSGYACGASVLPACSVGAPHIRNRCWFVAHANGGNASAEGLQRGGEQRQQPQDGGARELGDAKGGDRRLPERSIQSAHSESARPSEAGVVGNSEVNGGGPFVGQSSSSTRRQESAGGSGVSGHMADTASRGFGEQRNAPRPRSGRHADGGEFASGLGDTERRGRSGSIARLADGRGSPRGEWSSQADGLARPGPLVGFWSDAEWIACTDGKSRPVGPGSFPLGHGIQRRPSKLRAYGNAIVPQVAEQFIRAYIEAIDCPALQRDFGRTA